tara:strand:+ start:333 stop:653 length:321 start_codon:yes stop_codon:yes gene_type:complete
MLKSGSKVLKSIIASALLLVSTGPATAQVFPSYTYCTILKDAVAQYLLTLDSYESKRRDNVNYESESKGLKALHYQRKIEKLERDRDDLLPVLVQLSTIHKNLCQE